MIINDSIKVKNYKCFDSDGGGFERIMPINIIIGKNNSGKSSLIDIIKLLIKTDEDFFKNLRNDSIPKVLVEHKILEKDIPNGFKSSSSGESILDQYQRKFGLSLIYRHYTYKLGNKGENIFEKFEVDNDHKDVKTFLSNFATHLKKPFNDKEFCHIASERDIQPEGEKEFKYKPNGNGATNYIQQIINIVHKDSKLIEIELLHELNKIVNPDIKFSRILVQLYTGFWEIYFEDSNNNRIALSKMGSGIKTILLVLLNLIVRPKIENKKRNEYVFAFEELENNLHPALQRRLYDYIKKYSEANSTYFFITTHSNIVIDTFGTYENAQMIHVVNDGKTSSKTNTILSHKDSKQVLKDLDIRASDILQSNGIIWVEGPSDRIYINKWLEIMSPELKEGLHYSIMFYGGRLLSNVTFNYDWFNKEIIPLIKINTNAFVIIDRDGNITNAKINETKQRIKDEINFENCWITKGREIENYLSDETINKWLLMKHENILKINFKNDINIKLENNISNCNKKIKIKYNDKKLPYSKEIIDFIDKDSMAVLDLKENLTNLISKIKEWNQIN